MANPQIEKGYTRIANELLDQVIAKNLNGTQFRLVIAIWRYTYGIKGKKSNKISLRFLSEKTNANKRQVERELSTLINRDIVRVIGTSEKGARVLQVNKDYDQWDQKDTGLSGSEQKSTQSNIKPKYDEENTYYKMATYFYNRVKNVAEDAGIGHLTKRANMQTWADDMRKLVEIDQVDKKTIKNVMDWVTQHDFWKTNVLSASKLRQKFMELAIKMTADNASKQNQKSKVKDSRDKEIEFQQWISEGNDPDEFNWNE